MFTQHLSSGVKKFFIGRKREREGDRKDYLKQGVYNSETKSYEIEKSKKTNEFNDTCALICSCSRVEEQLRPGAARGPDKLPTHEML